MKKLFETLKWGLLKNLELLKKVVVVDVCLMVPFTMTTSADTLVELLQHKK